MGKDVIWYISNIILKGEKLLSQIIILEKHKPKPKKIGKKKQNRCKNQI